MAEPSRRSSRLLLAGAAAASIALAAGGFALGRASSDQPPPPPTPAPPPIIEAPTAPPPTLPQIAPPLGRAELIAAAAAAADASSAGQPLPEQVAGLAGRPFEIRLPFGCAGAAADPSGTLSWTYAAEDQALRLRAEPVRWSPAEWLPLPEQPDAEPAVESMEGFWLARPWTASDACPQPLPSSPAGSPPSPPAQTLGLAEFFTPDGSRVGRRDGKPFEAVEKVAPEALAAAQGFRLRLRGRVAAAPNGRTVLCRSPGPNARPQCLIAVALDEVAFENPLTNETLATWDVASQTSATQTAR